MNHIERMKMIDEFFDNLSIEEFENLAIDCGFNEIKSLLRFKNYTVNKIEFYSNTDFQEKEQVVVDFDIKKKVEFIEDDNNTMLVTLLLSIFDNPKENNYPFSMNIEITGIFELDGAGLEMKKVFAESNSIAILFPYVRALISTYTANANVPPLILPPINVNKLVEENKLAEK